MLNSAKAGMTINIASNTPVQYRAGTRASWPAPRACETKTLTAVNTPWSTTLTVMNRVAPSPPAASASPPRVPSSTVSVMPIAIWTSWAIASGLARRIVSAA